MAIKQLSTLFCRGFSGIIKLRHICLIFVIPAEAGIQREKLLDSASSAK